MLDHLFWVSFGEDILVGQNVIFDYSFLKQAAINRKMSFERKAADTLKIARRCLPALEKRTLVLFADTMESRSDTITVP